LRKPRRWGLWTRSSKRRRRELDGPNAVRITLKGYSTLRYGDGFSSQYSLGTK
jgi:hypothetical protein